MVTSFDTEAMRATAALIENATGIKIGTVDLTYMDGDEWPLVESGFKVVGELKDTEFGLFKAMVETAKKRDKVRQKITGILMKLAAEKLMRGDDDSADMQNVLGGMVQMLVARAGDVPVELLQEQAMHDEAYDLMSKMLYFGLKSRFHCHGEDNIGLRRGGKVVVPNRDKQS